MSGPGERWARLTGPDFPLIAATVFFVELAAVLALRQGGWLLDVDITGAGELALAALVAIGVVGWAFGLNLRRALLASLAAKVVVAVAVLLSLGFEDGSMDGQTYHFYLVDQLARGWNPYAEYKDYWPDVVNHYAKGAETYQSDLVHLTGARAAAFALNVAAAVMAMAIVQRSLRAEGIGWIAALLIVVNPIVATQFFTKYVDGVLSCLVVALVFAHLLRLQRVITGRQWAVLAAGLSYALMSVKFTGVFYAVVIDGLFVLMLMARDGVGRKWLFAPAVLLLFAAVPHPYLTNLEVRGDPFYPVLEDSAETITSRYPFEDFQHLNPVQKFFVANMSPPKKYFTEAERPEIDANYGTLKRIKYTFGWIFYQSEYSIKINGFGILWPALFWLALFCLFRYARPSRGADGWFAAAAAAMIAMGVVMPEGWLARLAPMVYSGAALAIVWGARKWRPLPRRIALAAMILNIGLSLSLATAQNLVKSVRIRAEAAAIPAGAEIVATGLLAEWSARLARRGARVEIVTDPVAFAEICGDRAFAPPSNGGQRICVRR